MSILIDIDTSSAFNHIFMTQIVETHNYVI